MESDISFGPLYLSHFLSAWGERAWEFGAALLLISAFSGSLRLPAIFGFALSAATVLFGGAIGDWVDRTNRLLAIKAAVVVQNLGVAASAGSLMCLLRLQEVHGVDNVQWWLRDSLALLCVVFGMVGAVGAMTSKVAIEQDWVAALAGGDEAVLGTVNSRMRRIDLLCKILAPTVVGFLVSYDPQVAAASIAGWNVLAMYFEYAPVRTLYLKARAKLDKDEDCDAAAASAAEEGAASEVRPADDAAAAAATRRKRRSCCAAMVAVCSRLGGRSFKVYRRQTTYLPALALATIYLTVLSFGTLTTAFLKWTGLPETLLGAARGVGAVFGLTSTFVFAPMRRCTGTARTGHIGIILQLLCIVPCCAAAIYAAPWLRDQVSHAGLLPAGTPSDPGWVPSWWITDPTSASGTGKVPAVAVLMMIGGLIISRFGLWVFDLSVSQLMQVYVAKTERGAVNGVQQSLQQLFQMASFGIGIVVSAPEDFGYLMLGSFLVVVIGTIIMSVYSCGGEDDGGRARRQKTKGAPDGKEAEGESSPLITS